uniref:Chitin-binding type-2 domain-containing protein n=1 Tax=Anopheles minimus TaxID=112268 RepID=A0A182W5J4_9DIPT
MRQTLMRGVASVVLLLVQTLPASGLANFTATGRCEQAGAIPDEESDTCATYYLCAVTSDNGLVPLYAQCPGSTVFSRELRQCVDASTYQCPGVGPNPRVSREAGFQCTEDGRFRNVESTDCKTYYLCTKNTDGSLIAALLNCPSSTIFSEEKRSCVTSPPNVCPYALITTTDAPQTSSTLGEPGDAFVCPSEGRFANEESPDCSTYYMCTIISSQLVPLLTACAGGLVFSPTEGVCVLGDTYTCPKLTETPVMTTTQVTTIDPSTTPTATVTTDATTPITLVPPTSTSTSTEAPTPTSEMTGSTTPITLVPPSSTTTTTEAPTPTSEMTTEVTTTTSEAPTPTSEMTTEVSASTTEVTETTEATTSTTLIPPSSTTTTTEAPTPATEQSETPPPIKLTTSTRSTPTTENDVTSPTVSPMPSTTDIDSQLGSTTLAPISTTPELFQCPGEGRYPDPNSSNCESYIMCVNNSIGSLTPIQFLCSPGTIFSATAGYCVSAVSHSCEHETSSSEPPTTVSPTGTTTIMPTPIPFVCPGVGRYPNPGSIYCKSYYLCLPDAQQNLIAVELSCPGSSIFATDDNRCAPAEEYRCDGGIATTVATIPTSTSTTTTVSTTSTTTTTSATTISTAGACAMAGKFPTNTPNDCTSYQFCVLLASGDLVELILKCPGTTLFDEQKKTCSDTFVCSRGP